MRELKKRGVPIAIATGSNTANYKWKTVRLIYLIYQEEAKDRIIYLNYLDCSLRH